MPAFLFGSISALADTSELQRAAFNQAFVQHDLDWTWDRDTYRGMLGGNGGAQRIADHARELGVEVDADAVHTTKSELFRQWLAGTAVTPRPGVADAITDARAAGWRVGLVTTTSAENVDALLGALSAYVPRESFDVVVSRADVDEPKPSPAAYTYALDRLQDDASASIAIEDNPGGVESARAAGVTVVAFPNENTTVLDFGDTARITSVSFGDLTAGVAS